MTMSPCKDTTNELLVNTVGLKQQLDRTKKKLDEAIWGLEWIFGYENVPKYVLQHIRTVLDKINQKEEK